MSEHSLKSIVAIILFLTLKQTNKQTTLPLSLILMHLNHTSGNNNLLHVFFLVIEFNYKQWLVPHHNSQATHQHLLSTYAKSAENFQYPLNTCQYAPHFKRYTFSLSKINTIIFKPTVV
jgi:hypothetical protein